MSFLDVFDSAKNLIKGATKPPAVATGQSASDLIRSMDKTYKLETSNWYTAKPYGFKMNRRDGRQFVMFLPIGPSNISINTNFATNIVPTLYGTIEEHSDVRYYDITIEGTTGMAPKFVEPQMGEYPHVAFGWAKRNGRSSFSVEQGLKLGGLGGFFPKSVALLNKTLNKAADIFDGGTKDTKSGFTPENSGYAAFHNLYRFLMEHKKDTAGSSSSAPRKDKNSPLVFFNYKDNNQYSVIIRNFVLRRSADNPMLYYYSIQMRGYNLKTVEGIPPQEALSDRLEALGLNGVQSSSLFGSMKSLSNGVKSIVGAGIGGVNVLGR